MEKPQVTIALRASELTGPLGTVVLAVTEPSNGPPGDFVILRGNTSGLWEARRFPVAQMPIPQERAVALSALVDQELDQTLLFRWGIQEDLSTSR